MIVLSSAYWILLNVCSLYYQTFSSFIDLEHKISLRAAPHSQVLVVHVYMSVLWFVYILISWYFLYYMSVSSCCIAVSYTHLDVYKRQNIDGLTPHYFQNPSVAK